VKGKKAAGEKRKREPVQTARYYNEDSAILARIKSGQENPHGEKRMSFLEENKEKGSLKEENSSFGSSAIKLKQRNSRALG